MPFDKVPGYNLSVPTQQFSPPPVRNLPSPDGAMIAQAAEGLMKIIGNKFDPETKTKNRLSKVQLAIAEKKLNDELTGSLDPLQQQRLTNMRAQKEYIDVRKTKAMKDKPAKPVKPKYQSPYHLPDGNPIAPPEPLPVADPTAMGPLSGIGIPEQMVPAWV